MIFSQTGFRKTVKVALKEGCPLAPPRTLKGVGLWNITDVLEFPSTLMEQRTLDAGGVLNINSSEYPGDVNKSHCQLKHSFLRLSWG